jgi:hypothetical protein
MKQKTILQHLNRLPECVRLDVKLEFVRQGVNLDYVVYWIQLSDIIMNEISWFRSELGEGYYEDLYSELCYHEQHNIKLPK